MGFKRHRARPRRRAEAGPFALALRRLRDDLEWTQEHLASVLSVSRRTLVSWECAYWLPPVKQRVQLVLSLRAVPPEHVLDVAAALGLANDAAVAPLLAPFERALDGDDAAPSAPDPPAPRAPRPTPEGLRAAVDAVVLASADALDVRASDLRGAVARVLSTCAELGADVDDLRAAVATLSPAKKARG